MAYIRDVPPSPRYRRPRWRVYHEVDGAEVKVGIYETRRQAERIRDQVNRYGLAAVLGTPEPEPEPAAATAEESRSKPMTLFGDYVTKKWWPAWAATHPETESNTSYRLNKRILPVFEQIPLGELDADAIGRWRADLIADKLSPQTINGYLSLLGVILNAAVDSDYLDRSPLLRKSGTRRVAAARKLPVEKREVWLSREQLDTLADKIEERYRAFVLVAALTGMRFGELIALRWRDPRLDVEFNDGAVAGVGRLRITKAVTDPSRAGRGYEKPPKTRAGRREIALDQETVDALTTHRKLVGGDDGDLIFTTAGGARGPGGMLASHNFSRVWKRAVTDAKLTGLWAEFGGLHFHDLRHTHATWLIARLVPPIAVAKRLGHASPVVTMTVYAHVTELVQAGSLTTNDLGLADGQGT